MRRDENPLARHHAVPDGEGGESDEDAGAERRRLQEGTRRASQDHHHQRGRGRGGERVRPVGRQQAEGGSRRQERGRPSAGHCADEREEREGGEERVEARLKEQHLVEHDDAGQRPEPGRHRGR